LAYQFGNTIIVEDADGEVVKTYELPSKSKPPKKDDPNAGTMQKGFKQMEKWTGLAPKDSSTESGAVVASSSTAKPTRAPMTRLGSLRDWGFGGKNTESAPMEDNEDDDDRRIRFKIGGAGKRLTKEDFLKEIQGLDPKARCEIVEESDAPAVMKAMAKQDASSDSRGSSRLLGSKSSHMTSGKGIAKAIGAEMAKRKGAKIEEDDEDSSEEYFGHDRRKRHAAAPRRLSRVDSASDDGGETAVERKRREKAFRGTDDSDVSPGRGRATLREGSDEEPSRETAAERKRREAALGVGSNAQDDSDDDDTPRVPPPAKSRGIRFADSPVRGKN